MKVGKINEVGSHLHKALRNSSLWNSRLWGDLFSFFFWFSAVPSTLSSSASRKKYAPKSWDSFCLKAKGRP